MRAASTQATTQLETAGNEPPNYAFVVTLSLPGGVFPDASVVLNHVKIDAATTTDVPDGTRIDEGYPTRTASFTLAGSVDPTDETKTVGWLFGRYSTTSPLYRLDCFRSLVTIDVNLYPQGALGVAETFRQFTGYVDDYTENPDGTVDFDCIDFRSSLRNVPDIPAVVTAAPYNAGLTSEFAVDALLRSSTSGAISTWDAIRPNCVLSIGMRSSVWPEVGNFLLGHGTPVPVFAHGPYGSALVSAPNPGSFPGYNNVPYVTTAPIGTSAYLGFQVFGLVSRGPTSLYFGGTDETMTVTVTSTGVTVQGVDFGDAISTYTVAHTFDDNLHKVEVVFTLPAAGGTAWTAAVYVDATLLGTSSGKAFTSIRDSDQWTFFNTDAAPPFISSAFGAGLAAIQLTTETSPVITPFTPGAVLDPSLNPMQVVPEITGDPWQTIQDIAAAEQAVAGFDESGIFRFYNRRTLASTTIARSVTSSYSLMSLNVQNSTASVINRAQVGYTSWTTAPAPSTWIYTHDVVTKIPRKGTVTLTPTLDSFATNLDSGVSGLANGSTATNFSNYRASVDSAGSKEHPGLNFAVTQPSGANKLTIVITNTTSLDAYLVSPANYTDFAAGTIFLHIAGRVVTQNTEQTADIQYPATTYTWPSGLTGAAGSRFGEVAWQLSGNQWIQDADTATQLATEVVALADVPLPDLASIDIVPDPRLQLTDIVHIQDPDVSNVDEYGRVFGTTIEYQAADDPLSAPTYTQTIDARTLAAPGGWILGIAGRSEIGTGSGTSDSTAYLYPAS